MTKYRTVQTTGLNETLRQLDELGRQGDEIAREAANAAAKTIRADYIVRQLSRDTGVSQAVLLASSRVQKANRKYPYSRINFSSGGIPVNEYGYRLRPIDATRAQILIEWVGGREKLAAGFINPKGSKQAALTTRNERVTNDRMSIRQYRLPGEKKRGGKKATKQLYGKRYTYYNGRLGFARGPSMATMFKALPEGSLDNTASQQLAAEVVHLLDQYLGKKS